MKEKIKEGEREKQATFQQILIYILIIVGVIALGVLAVNQTIGFYYKSQLLQGPCALCAELNPHLEPCFLELSTTRTLIDPITRKPFKFNMSNIKINSTSS